MNLNSEKHSAAGRKNHVQVAPEMGTICSQKEFQSTDLNPGPLAHHSQPPGKTKHVADHFTKSPIKVGDFGNFYFLQTHVSFFGITLLFYLTHNDPQTPLPSRTIWLMSGTMIPTVPVVLSSENTKVHCNAIEGLSSIRHTAHNNCT
jgi:hypothetical protein